jgi:hypothetical protein
MIANSFVEFIILRISLFIVCLFIFATLSKRIGAVVLEEDQQTGSWSDWIKRLRW